MQNKVIYKKSQESILRNQLVDIVDNVSIVICSDFQLSLYDFAFLFLKFTIGLSTADSILLAVIFDINTIHSRMNLSGSSFADFLHSSIHCTMISVYNSDVDDLRALVDNLCTAAETEDGNQYHNQHDSNISLSHFLFLTLSVLHTSFVFYELIYYISEAFKIHKKFTI